MPLVLDASVAMSWCFDDEASAETDRVFQDVVNAGAVVPAVWPVEVAHVLAKAQAHARVSASQADSFLAVLEQLPIEIADHCDSARSLMAAAVAHSSSASDVSYLLLALRHGYKLA